MKLSINHRVTKSVFVLGLLAALALTGCAPKPEIPFTEMSIKTSLSQSQQEKLLAQIEDAGVQVIQQGSRLQLILPVNKFFLAQTTDARENQVKTLQLIALYLHNYTRTRVTNYPIKIFAYTGTVHTRQYRQSLSEQFAQVIAAYMWSHGFSPERMSVVGYGAKNPIANYRTPVGNAYNRRVMIQVN